MTDLVSSLPRDECVRRLRATVSSYWSIGPGIQVVGSVDSDTIRLRKRIYYRNSFQPTLRGRLSDEAGGTRLHCEFSTIPLTPILLAAAAVFVVAIGLVVALLARSNVRLTDVPLAAIIAPLAALPFFVGLGFGVVALGRRFARDEPQFLLDFLRRTLEVKA